MRDEEAMAAVLGEHLAGDYTHLFFDDPGAINPPVRCRCGWRGRESHAAHQAAELARAGFGSVAAAKAEAELVARGWAEEANALRAEVDQLRHEADLERNHTDDCAICEHLQVEDLIAQAERAEDALATAKASALREARDALYRGEGPDAYADADIVYGEWIGNRADQIGADQ